VKLERFENFERVFSENYGGGGNWQVIESNNWILESESGLRAQVAGTRRL
jgi:hypothetical protein